MIIVFLNQNRCVLNVLFGNGMFRLKKGIFIDIACMCSILAGISYFTGKIQPHAKSASPFVFVESPKDFSSQFEVAGCFCEHAGKFLYLLRNPQKPQGNTWCVPGGKLDEGETPLRAVIREVEEEIGLRIPEESLMFCRKVYVRLSGRDFVLHLFRAKLEKVPKKFNIARDEHIAFRWVTYGQALRMPLIPGGKDCLNYVCAQPSLQSPL